MVNKLSNLAEFLHNDSLPEWLKSQIDAQQEEISEALLKGREYTIAGPSGEEVRISPKTVAVS